jgi:hypothetical protein
MKKLTLTLVVGLSLIMMISCAGAPDGGKRSTPFELEVKENFQPGEEAAQQVLLAYRTKDVDLLKQYAGSMMRMALDESAMERPDYEDQLNSWDGSINEVRYDSDVLNFEKVYYAHSFYYADGDQPDQLYVVSLESRDKEKWVITLNPLRKMSREKFMQKSETIPE